ncbi:MAG: hypothetical protein HC901_02785 [Bdellovibrionaceae bacterium]|nr:hypothetical protein [Pseudobdellovibrionaceae bacterium]
MFNWPRPGSPHLPTPFLLAGDPRFEKMVRLAFLPEEQMLRVFNEWPEARDLPPEVREELPQRLTSFRDRVRHEAVKAAEEWGIALTPENRADFVRAYWEERIRLEREIRTRAQAELEQRQSGIRQNLMTRFGVR